MNESIDLKLVFLLELTNLKAPAHFKGNFLLQNRTEYDHKEGYRVKLSDGESYSSEMESLL